MELVYIVVLLGPFKSGIVMELADDNLCSYCKRERGGWEQETTSQKTGYLYNTCLPMTAPWVMVELSKSTSK